MNTGTFRIQKFKTAKIVGKCFHHNQHLIIIFPKFRNLVLSKTRKKIVIVEVLTYIIDASLWWLLPLSNKRIHVGRFITCLLYTSDAADDMQCVDLGGRRIIKKEP